MTVNNGNGTNGANGSSHASRRRAAGAAAEQKCARQRPRRRVIDTSHGCQAPFPEWAEGRRFPNVPVETTGRGGGMTESDGDIASGTRDQRLSRVHIRRNGGPVASAGFGLVAPA